jgi:hypothetical protein
MGNGEPRKSEQGLDHFMKEVSYALAQRYERRHATKATAGTSRGLIVVTMSNFTRYLLKDGVV